MTETIGLRAENAALRLQNELLLRRAEDAEEAFRALARGEVDAVVHTASATPLLLRAAQEQFRASRQLLRAIFDGVLDTIVLADDGGTYVDANPAASALFGLPHDELLGRRFADFAVPQSDQPGFDELRRRGQLVGVFPIRRPDGTTRIVDFTAVANVAPGRHLAVLRDITDRVATVDALRRSEALFRAVIEKSSEAITLTARDGTTRYLTPSAWPLLGWRPDEVDGQTLRDQVVPEGRTRIASEVDRFVRSGNRDMATEFQVRHRDGSLRWFEATSTNLLDDPDVGAIVSNHRDITARKRADEALREGRDQLEEAQTLAHLGRWAAGVGADDEITWSAECALAFGIPVGEAVTKPLFFARVHPDDRVLVRRALGEMLASDRTSDVEHRVAWPDGTIRWVHSRAIVDRDAAGHPQRMHGTIQDVTDRHSVVAALRASEERYRRIVETTSEGVWMYDATSTTTFMNARMAAMLGCSVEEAVGQPIFAFMDDATRAHARAGVERRRNGISERRDLQLHRRDGTAIWTSVQSNALFDLDGCYEGALTLVSDVSAERRADETRARLAAIVDSSDDAIIGASPDGTVTSWNSGAEKLYQYRAEEMVGRSVFLLVPSGSQADERRLLERAAAGEGAHAYETTRYRKDGSTVDVAVMMSPVRDAERKVIGVAKIARDLTTRRRAEAELHRTEDQLRQAQKMEAVGRLAGGVAHDFNNLLSVILSYAQFAIEDLKPGDPLRDDMIQIDQAGQRAADLTKQLLAFSRQQVLQPRVVDLNQIILPMERMLRRLLGEDVALPLLATPDLGRVLADPGQLEQVVMNLAVNARDAMPEGGSLTVETGGVRIDAGDLGGPAGIVPGDYITLAVSDTGIGMDAATAARIFEPFFTTKPVGKGTGLGLSTVFGIVRQSGGYVGVASELGRGSTLTIYLPRTDHPADAPSVEEVPAVLRGSETILLVEDEEQVRAVACAILRRNGYTVLETSNGGEAFLVSKQYGATIDLLLTDVVMPRMNGRQLAEELAPQRPGMKVLFASGYTDDVILRHGVLDAGVAFVQKPFTPQALLRKVREVLAR